MSEKQYVFCSNCNRGFRIEEDGRSVLKKTKNKTKHVKASK